MSEFLRLSGEVLYRKCKWETDEGIMAFETNSEGHILATCKLCGKEMLLSDIISWFVERKIWEEGLRGKR